jgi:uncharacterized protein (DUF1810 family)
MPTSKQAGDSYNLDRFIAAQKPVFEHAYKELLQGRKTGHWMWFIFPQIEGLGFSEMSKKFAISSLGEARAYLVHPILGQRLRKVCDLVAQMKNKSMNQVFGSPDDLKLKSSLTLFSRATTDNALFLKIIEKQFEGEFDQQTLDLLNISDTSSQFL